MTRRKTRSRRRAASSTTHSIPRWLRKTLIVATGLTLAVLVLLTQFFSLLYDESFYQKEFERNRINIDGNEIGHARELLAFFRGDAELTGDFYSIKEKTHLDDVQRLIASFNLARYAALVFFVILMIIFYLRTDFMNSSGRIFVVAGIALLCILALAGLFVIYFDTTWIWFHQVLFTNDLWLLNPATDQLIQLFPQAFFMDFSMALALRIGLLGIFLVIAGIFLKKYRSA